MKVNVIGLGYIGLPTALMFATHGVEVVGTDYNSELVKTLNEGQTTFDEKGLDEVSKKKLDMISKYIDSFQKDEAIKLKDKFLNFNKVVSEDEEFVEIVRW